jgi:hypothetical protein
MDMYPKFKLKILTGPKSSILLRKLSIKDRDWKHKDRINKIQVHYVKMGYKS